MIPSAPTRRSAMIARVAIAPPMLALVNAGFVLQTFAGRVVAWDAQARADRLVHWNEAIRLLALPTLLGAGLCLAAWKVGGWFGVWLAPTAAGLLLGPVLTVLSSRIDLGHLSRRLGLFLTTDDIAPAPELVALHDAARARTTAMA